MSAEMLRGAPVASALRKQVIAVIEANKVQPCLANIVVGENPAAGSYLDSLDKAASKRGIATRRLKLDEAVTQDELCEAVVEAGRNQSIHGLMIQFPLPQGIERQHVTDLIPSARDVDGLTTESLGAVLAGSQRHTAPATAAAVCEILASDERLDPCGRTVTVVGRSLVVGRPLSAMLTASLPGGNATVTTCHSRSQNLAEHTRQADIVVMAVGRRHMLTPDMVKPGAIVIDVGTHPVERDGKWTLDGDVHPDVEGVAGFMTPVPGGVGIVTTAVLMRHVAAAACPGVMKPAW
ncbi:MAG: bifunctional 5,10-methylenetetrahydrofolate dehydrogenase/5,10-methenyltetrahydrofolate cyclohydrolase [Planctomycetota bacterium]|jgi:methylenetetrahydrofolate dehydrogenase (NADP+) / methenyltetrahydrofolate cyclohydrolase|nr:bifunctional 5,10-methylenetetrahydrofolate dehydrogenase/5,10-methenyltetrahydrofolate cyclohydrolase [Planctomycetota bacterium]